MNDHDMGAGRGATRPEESILAKSDDALVACALQGSAEGFNVLVDRYETALVRYAYRFTHDRQDADDIAQETFLKAYRKLETLPSGTPFSRWLFTIARNSSLSALRRKRTGAKSIELLSRETVAAVDIETLVLRNDDAANVRRAINTLPLRHRTALAMHYLGGLRYREIAERLDLPLGTVKTYVSRGKSRLRSELSPAHVRTAA